MPVRRRRSKRRSIKFSKKYRSKYKKISNRKSNKRYKRTKINKKTRRYRKTGGSRTLRKNRISRGKVKRSIRMKFMGGAVLSNGSHTLKFNQLLEKYIIDKYTINLTPQLLPPNDSDKYNKILTNYDREYIKFISDNMTKKSKILNDLKKIKKNHRK